MLSKLNFLVPNLRTTRLKTMMIVKAKRVLVIATMMSTNKEFYLSAVAMVMIKMEMDKKIANPPGNARTQ